MTTKETRVRMTQEQKKRLRDHHAQFALKHSALAKWAAREFKLAKPPSRMTLSRVLRELPPTQPTNPATKSVRAVTSPALEATLVQWIRRCEELQLPVVTGATVRAKAAKIRAEIVASANHGSARALEAMTFSAGWLSKLQRRHGLSCKRVHGEAASVSKAAVSEGRARLQEITRGFERRNVFNMDETAFFYCASPSTSITKDNIAGRKAIKKRLTVAVCCNADGSTKLPLLFVGAVRAPRFFGRRPAHELGLQYESTPKGWMNGGLFNSWLTRFNERMRDEDRRILLLVDNVASHRLNTALSNITVRMLPPNTTAYLQPQDAGIIRAFKAAVRRIQHHHVVDRLDEVLQHAAAHGDDSIERETSALFQVDVLVAMRWAEEAWAAVTQTTITNCWTHTQILDEEIYELTAGLEKLRFAPPKLRQILK